MHVIVPLAERAARLPAGPSNPECHAGMSFTALRDASSLQPGEAARVFFIERLQQLADVASALASGGDRRSSAGHRAISCRSHARRVVDSTASTDAWRRCPASAGKLRRFRSPRAAVPHDRRRCRACARREAGADVRDQALHPRTLLRHRRAEGLSRERAGVVDSSGRDAGGARRRRSPTPVLPARSVIVASTARATRLRRP